MSGKHSLLAVSELLMLTCLAKTLFSLSHQLTLLMIMSILVFQSKMIWWATFLISMPLPKKRWVMIRPNTPWFSDKIHSAKCDRRDLEHKWRKSNLEIDRQMYCEQRQVVKHMIEEAKTSYYSASVDMCDGGQKSLYSVVNNLLRKNKEPVLPSSSSDLILANKFSDYFVGKIENIPRSFSKHCELPNDGSSDHVTRISEF